MLRSLYSGVSGLRAHQTKMDVIGNNIANVNTTGFKASRVLFKDIFYQTVGNSSAPGAGNGGVNPKQIGYGSTVASIDVINSRSGFQPTDVPTDLYISGEGYFQVQDGTVTKYTRVGNFRFDTAGNLVDAQNGYIVCGGVPTIAGGPAVPITLTVNINDYTEISIGLDGSVNALNTTTGVMETIAQIAVVKFPNPSALNQEGDMYYSESQNSGAPLVTVPGTNGTGTLVSGGLEMSNVDLSKEFTDMIITQRGFQANSRVITTSDEILQELVNLKR